MTGLKKFLSLVLVFVLTFSALCIVNAEAEQYTPILRIRGEDDLYWVQEDGTRVKLYDDGEYVSAIVDAALPYALLGLATGNWDKWCDVAWEKLKPAYEHYKPDAEGNLPSDTVLETREQLSDYGYSNNYEVNGGYQFHPDMRISPMDEADNINAVVEKIKAETHCDKIILIGQCLGNAYMAAYLQKYEEPNDFAGVESVVFSTTTSNGLPNENALLSGQVKFNKEVMYKGLSVYPYPEAITEMAGGEVLQVLMATLELAYESKIGGKLTIDVVQRVYNAVKDKFIARILREYYGRCGGYVSAISYGYEAYKDYVFPTQEDKQTYAAQIAKFDDYHYNVQLRQPEMIRKMRELGIAVSDIVQYGFQSEYFLSDDCLETCDRRVPVSWSSFGAKSCKTGETLSDEYIDERAAAGFGAYISPDRQIDASTALMPDTTWFVKNSPHLFDGVVTRLVTAIVRTPGATVQTLAEQGYPQFLYYTGEWESLRPLTAEDTDEATAVTPKTNNFFAALIQWFKSLFALLRTVLKG